MSFSEPGFHHMKLARTAKTMAFFALFSALFQTVIFPYIFGGLSILFAAISKGNTKQYQLNAKIAIWISVIVMILNSLFIGITTYNILYNDAFKAKLNTTTQQIYGMNFDDFLDQIYDSYGFNMMPE